MMPVMRVPQRIVSNSTERVYPAKGEKAKESKDLEMGTIYTEHQWLLLAGIQS